MSFRICQKLFKKKSNLDAFNLRITPEPVLWRQTVLSFYHYTRKISLYLCSTIKHEPVPLWSGCRGDSPGESRAADIMDRASLEQVNFRLKYRTEMNISLIASRRNRFSALLPHAASLCVWNNPSGPSPPRMLKRGYLPSQRLRSPLLSISARDTTTIPVYRACLTGLWRTAAACILL